MLLEILILLVTFLFGILALTGWTFVTLPSDPSFTVLKRSLWIALLFPLLSLPFEGAVAGLKLLLTEVSRPKIVYAVDLLLFVFFEEAFKLWAARKEKSGIRAFALVSLFGIFELIFIKPFLMINVQAVGLEIIWLQLFLLPAVFMHFLTAAIYAYFLREKPFIQFSVCAAIHAAFNLAADHIYMFGDATWIASVIPMGVATWLLVPRRGSSKRGSWSVNKSEMTDLG